MFKKHAPFFYETLFTYGLTWPSLTVEWMPSRVHGGEFNGEEYSSHKLLIGTHVSQNAAEGNEEEETQGEANQIQIMSVKMPVENPKMPAVSHEKKERFAMDIVINHPGEVNKARHMPQSHNIIATKTVSGEVHIYDYFKHPTKPNVASEIKPP